MIKDLSPGVVVVAKGKVAIVKQVFSEKSIKVQLTSTGESLIVSFSDIELIDASPLNTPGEKTPERLITECSLTELELSARRFNTIKRWRSGNRTVAEASVELGISSNHLYKLNKAFDENIGSLSLLSQKRGRKYGATRLTSAVEDIIVKTTKKIYKSRAASYRKVWTEVQVTCAEKNLDVPSKDSVTRRIKSILSEKERDKIKLGSDAANQKHTPRAGKKKTYRPLEWVQMDHTLVDIILLADNRRELIGRPWLTVLIDLHTRVILGYYLSLHVPSSVSVACALTHAVLPKDNFTKMIGLEVDDYCYFGLPTALHMDNAAEFTSPKLKVGCESFGIEPVYRPIARKHYGGHVERFIGTMMTSKVHFLKGATMSNVVARRNLESERKAVMTFSEFSRWFAREIVVYHSTIHEELKFSPRQAWTNFFASGGGQPYPTRVSDPLQFKLFFMPEETRDISPSGIEFHNQKYWDPLLNCFIGNKNVVVKYDPYLPQSIWVKLDGEFYPVGLSDLTLNTPSYEEYRASKFHRKPVNSGAIVHPSGMRAYREKQEIEQESEKLTK
ncbi:MAG: transposase, partial [Pseudomonas sp.]|nr:transposase [Pseudomonas sp.]MBQ0778516.1 transposase [Pseudomonas sp.]